MRTPKREARAQRSAARSWAHSPRTATHGAGRQLGHAGAIGAEPEILKYMRAFATAWPRKAIVQGPLAQITWYHKELKGSLPTVAEIEAEFGR